MKLLVVTQYYPPEMGASQARLSEMVTRLHAAGHTVTVLTAVPNYPTGKVFPAYRWKLRMTEEINGVHVIRTAVFPSKSSRAFPRLLCYGSFALSSVLLGVWGLGRHDVTLFDSPPLFLAPSGILIGTVAGGRIVMNVADIMPDLLQRTGHVGPGMALRLMLALERFAYRHSDLVTVTNPGAAQQLRERFPGLAVAVISGGVDTTYFRPELRSEAVRASLGAGPGDFLVGYCGLHGLMQGLEVVVQAAARLQDDPRIKLVMIGDGPVKQRLMALAQELKVTNLTFHDVRPKKEMPAIVSSCDASLVPLATRLPGTMPSKFYEALASGTPPLVAKGCEAEPLVNQHGVGAAFEPLDGAELAQAVRGLAADPGRHRRMREQCAALAKRFDRTLIAARTEKLFEAVAAGQPPPDVPW